MRMNEPYIPKPTGTATTLVVHAPRIFITSMSTSGSSTRDSTSTHTARIASPNRHSPIVFGEPQPHADVSLTEISTHPGPPASRLAPAQSTRPGDLIGDSGTQRQVAKAEPMIATSGIQNSQW